MYCPAGCNYFHCVGAESGANCQIGNRVREMGFKGAARFMGEKTKNCGLFYSTGRTIERRKFIDKVLRDQTGIMQNGPTEYWPDSLNSGDQ